jgi:hypothetical protein
MAALLSLTTLVRTLCSQVGVWTLSAACAWCLRAVGTIRLCATLTDAPLLLLYLLLLLLLPHLYLPPAAADGAGGDALLHGPRGHTARLRP